MFLLISPDHFGDAVVTVTAHAAFDIGVQDIFVLSNDTFEDGFDRIMTRAAGPEPITVWFEFGFPLRF
jgi:hypothetical protein